jgi:hypothetical protein
MIPLCVALNVDIVVVVLIVVVNNIALVDQQHIIAHGEDVSARLVLRSIVSQDGNLPHLLAGNLPHLLARGHVPEAHLSERTSGVSTLARPAKLIMRLSTQD